MFNDTGAFSTFRFGVHSVSAPSGSLSSGERPSAPPTEAETFKKLRRFDMGSSEGSIAVKKQVLPLASLGIRMTALLPYQDAL